MRERSGDERVQLGQRGEQIAAEYVQGVGYRVIERNVYRREGEIDLIALYDETLVSVEVKLRNPGVLGGAVESLTATKQRRRELAGAYAAEHPDLSSNLRIDVVAIDLAPDGGVERVQHLQSAVEG